MRNAAFVLSLLFLTAAQAAEPVVCADDALASRKIPLPSALVRRIDLCANAQKMQIHAHRGAVTRPENTMAAFREAIREGADTIEMDLQITKDDPATGKGTVVIQHDTHLRDNQCLDPQGRRQDPNKKAYVREMTLAEVQAYDCGSLVPDFAKPIPGEKIATLKEALGLLEEHPGLRFNIEIKYTDPSRFPPLDEYAQRIIDTIEESGTDPKRFFIQSFQTEALKAIKKKRPKWDVAILFTGDEKERPAMLKQPKEIGAHMVTPHFNNVTPEMLAKLHAQGVKVVPWTANFKEEMRPLIEMGVDGIITDRVGNFMELKKEFCGQ